MCNVIQFRNICNGLQSHDAVVPLAGMRRCIWYPTKFNKVVGKITNSSFYTSCFIMALCHNRSYSYVRSSIVGTKWCFFFHDSLTLPGLRRFQATVLRCYQGLLGRAKKIGRRKRRSPWKLECIGAPVRRCKTQAGKVSNELWSSLPLTGGYASGNDSTTEKKRRKRKQTTKYRTRSVGLCGGVEEWKPGVLRLQKAWGTRREGGGGGGFYMVALLCSDTNAQDLENISLFARK